MKTRVITGVVLAGVLIPIFIIGGIFFQLLLFLLTIGATYELFLLFNKQQQLPHFVGAIYLILSGGLYSVIMQYFNGLMVLEWVVLSLLLIMIIGGLLLVFVDDFHSDRYGEMVISILYPALGFASIYALREIDLYTIGFLFLITIATDIFAYIVGVNFGKHRLAIKISPKKSIEGSIGGTASAIILATIYVYAFNLTTIGNIPVHFGWILVLIFVISILGQIGDLVASKLKRYVGIKDFSNIFPGHGGILDRFDSAIFAAMVFILISQVVSLV